MSQAIAEDEPIVCAPSEASPKLGDRALALGTLGLRRA
jgi:hypothetical protein